MTDNGLPSDCERRSIDDVIAQIMRDRIYEPPPLEKSPPVSAWRVRIVYSAIALLIVAGMGLIVWGLR